MAIDNVALQNMKFYHKFILQSVLVADKEPLDLDKDACLPFTASRGSLKALKVQGIKLHSKLAIKHFESAGPSDGATSGSASRVRGVYSKSDLQNGTRILQVPFGAVLHKSQFHRSRIWPAAQRLTELGSSDYSILATVTAYEMMHSAQSLWLPLICNFPTTYPGLPFVWNSAQLRAVAQIPGFGAELLENVDTHAEQWSRILCGEVAMANVHYGAGHFVWAEFAIRSRSFGAPPALVPVADLLNHNRSAHVHANLEMILQPGQSEDQAVPGNFNMILNKDVAAGEEIFNSYGIYCQRRWLSNYGFLPHESEMPCHDEYR